MEYGHWDISLVGEFSPMDFIGFCYVIEFNDGTKYIGSKKLWKGIDCAPNCGDRTESIWRFYKSSQKRTINKYNEHKSTTKLIILSLHKTYAEVLFEENRLHKENDVGNNHLFLNLKQASTCVETSDIAKIATLYWKDLDYRHKVRMTKITNIVLKRPELYPKYFCYVPTREEVETAIYKRHKSYIDRGIKAAKSNIGTKRSIESRLKMSISATNKIVDVGVCGKISNSLTRYNKEHGKTKEHIQNIINARKKDENGKYVQRFVKSLFIDGIPYKSFRSASIALGITQHKLSKLSKDRVIVIYK